MVWVVLPCLETDDDWYAGSVYDVAETGAGGPYGGYGTSSERGLCGVVGPSYSHEVWMGGLRLGAAGVVLLSLVSVLV